MKSVTEEMLRDTAGLLKWHSMAANFKRFGMSDTDGSRLEVVTIAETALAEGDEPVKLFTHILKKTQRELSNAHDESARRRLRDHQRNSAGEPDVAVAGVLRQASENLRAPAVELPEETA
jgi:hypothetical protein